MKKTLLLLHILACCACVKATAAELVPPVTPPKPATPATITNDSYTFTGSGSPISLGEDICGTTGSWAISYEVLGSTFNQIVTQGGSFFALSVEDSNGKSQTITFSYTSFLGFIASGGGTYGTSAYVPFFNEEDESIPLLFQYDAENNTFTLSNYYEYDSEKNPHDLTPIISLQLKDGNVLEQGIPSGSLTITLPSGTAASNIHTWKGTVASDDIYSDRLYGIYWANETISESISGITAQTNEKYAAGITKVIAVSNASLKVDTDLPEGVLISTTVGTAGGSVEIAQNCTLNQSKLAATNDKKIILSGSGAYNLENGYELGTGIELSDEQTDGWSGTVYTGSIAEGTEELNVNQLGNANSTVQLGQDGDVTVESLTAEEVGTVKTPGNLTLLSQRSTTGNLEVQGSLTLGSTADTASLNTNGTLKVQRITLGNIGSSAAANKLDANTLNIQVTDSELLKLAGRSTAVLTLSEAYTGTTTLNGTEGEYLCQGKVICTLLWEAPLTRATTATTLNLYANINTEYVREKLAETVSSHNGITGMNMLNNVYAELNPQTNTPDGALAGLMDTVDAGAMGDKELAAAAGSSVAVLGQALSGDVERQLRAIRNRAADSTVGSDTVVVTSLDAKGHAVSTSKTNKFFVWVNAEGNRAEQDADGTAAGYSLFSWGGTLGAGMQVNNKLGLGLALTAMRGDLQSNGPDTLEGDMDTAYLSAFARYQSGAWSHSLIGTVGTMDADYSRTVSHAAGSYTTDGDTEGTALGLMYELSREYALTAKSSISPVFNVSYRHTEVDAYSESGSDAAVSVGDQSLDTVTLGLGARYAATVGQHTINRACALEARALAKYDLGDRQTDTTVGFIGHATRGSIESAELGAFGVELGAGIAVPVGPGSAFADGSVELRSDYTNFNATVGYKIQF